MKGKFYMQVYGLQKLTLLDYPEHMACTLFTGGCNFRCPFCHNASLVLHPQNQIPISKEEILSFLQKRQGILEGVCITGGEPTLTNDLISWIETIRSFGYLVKLDTNGTNPKLLSVLIENHFVDYIAMDIKNSREHYSVSVGISNYDCSAVEESVNLLKSEKIPYEFRTTVVLEHHTKEDFILLGEWLYGSSPYYLQAFQDSQDLICNGLHSYSNAELEDIRLLLLPYLPNTKIRGI